MKGFICGNWDIRCCLFSKAGFFFRNHPSTPPHTRKINKIPENTLLLYITGNLPRSGQFFFWVHFISSIETIWILLNYLFAICISLISQQCCQVGTVGPILQMKAQRPREVKNLPKFTQLEPPLSAPLSSTPHVLHPFAWAWIPSVSLNPSLPPAFASYPTVFLEASSIQWEFSRKRISRQAVTWHS